MSELLQMHMDMMELTFGDREPVTDEAVLYFPDLFDSPEIRINAPRAGEVGARIVELWNASISTTRKWDDGEREGCGKDSELAYLAQSSGIEGASHGDVHGYPVGRKGGSRPPVPSNSSGDRNTQQEK